MKRVRFTLLTLAALTALAGPAAAAAPPSVESVVTSTSGKPGGPIQVVALANVERVRWTITLGGEDRTQAIKSRVVTFKYESTPTGADKMAGKVACTYPKGAAVVNEPLPPPSGKKPKASHYAGPVGSASERFSIVLPSEAVDTRKVVEPDDGGPIRWGLLTLGSLGLCASLVFGWRVARQVRRG
jgi:hypothetical protein